jgi:hypothetical protein
LSSSHDGEGPQRDVAYAARFKTPLVLSKEYAPLFASTRIVSFGQNFPFQDLLRERVLERMLNRLY